LKIGLPVTFALEINIYRPINLGFCTSFVLSFSS